MINRKWCLNWAIISFFLFLILLMVNLELFVYLTNADVYSPFWGEYWINETPWVIQLVTFTPLGFSIFFITMSAMKTK